jgi:hypothetical protein
VGEAGGDGVPEKEKEARAAGRRSRMGGRRGHVGGVDTGHTLIGLFANDPPPPLLNLLGKFVYTTPPVCGLI